jgi:SAM-dependent methyltransferase
MNKAIVNTEQADVWNGQEGAHWVEYQDHYDCMMQRLTPRLFAAAAISAGERVLDVGCGCGETTRLAARAASRGSVLGVDLSAPMLARAREVADSEGLTNVSFDQGDVQVYPFEAGSFDVAFSHYGVMFFVDPVAAFANLAGALRPGGRLVFLCWQSALVNEWLMVPATAALAHVPVPDFGGEGPGPFSFSERERIVEVVSGAGFGQVSVEPVEDPLWLGTDSDDAVAFISGTGVARELLEGVDETTAARATESVRAALDPYAGPEGVWLGSASWLATART